MRMFCVLLGTMALAGVTAWSSELVTVRAGGSPMRGELVKVSATEIVLKVNGKETSLPVALVEPRDYVACARKLLDPKDAKAHATLADYCEKKDLPEDARDLRQMAAALDPKTYGGANKPVATAGPAKTPDPAALIEQMGGDDANIRDEAMAKLRDLGAKAAPALEKAVAESKDQEVVSRAKKLLAGLAYEKMLAGLSTSERALSELPFGEGENAGVGTLMFRAYGSDTYTVMEVGSLRVAISDQPYNGSSSCGLNTSGNGTSSVRAGSLQLTSSGGKTTGAFRGVNFKIESKVFKVDGKEFGYEGDRRLVILKKDGTYIKDFVIYPKDK